MTKIDLNTTDSETWQEWFVSAPKKDKDDLACEAIREAIRNQCDSELQTASEWLYSSDTPVYGFATREDRYLSLAATARAKRDHLLAWLDGLS